MSDGDFDLGFDLENVDAVVEVAVSVLQDYAGGDGLPTRIERLARWVATCFAGVDVRDERAGGISRQTITDVGVVEQANSMIGLVLKVYRREPLTPDQARDLARALLVAAERAEES